MDSSTTAKTKTTEADATESAQTDAAIPPESAQNRSGDDRDVFETPPVPPATETISEAKPAPSQSSPYRITKEHFIVAGMGVKVVEMAANAISVRPKMTDEQRTEGIETFAEALAANFPDIAAGRILTAISALLWSCDVIARRVHARRTKTVESVDVTDKEETSPEEEGELSR